MFQFGCEVFAIKNKNKILKNIKIYIITQKIHFLESTQPKYFLCYDKYNGREKKLIFNIVNFLFMKKAYRYNL